MKVPRTYIASNNTNQKIMTNFSSILKNAFRAPPAPPSVAVTDERASVKEIVRNRAHGNIRLQLGHWYTQGDVNVWRESLKGYSFVG